jgi:hypothetical protein
MGKLAWSVIAAAASAAGLVVLAAPAGSGGPPANPRASGPDGLLVLGAVGSRDRAGAVSSELALVADPRTGVVRSHRLPGGTLCGGPVLAGGDGVVFYSYGGLHRIALTLPLDLRGAPRSLGRAQAVAPLRVKRWLARLSVSPPANMRLVPWAGGALSSDERRLAVAVATRAGMRAAVLDIGTGSWTVVPGGRLGGPRSMAWTPSGEWLVFTAGARQLMAWRVGAGGALELGVHPGGRIMSLATTS